MNSYYLRKEKQFLLKVVVVGVCILNFASFVQGKNDEVDLEIAFKGNASLANVHAHSKVVVCYVGTWSIYRKGQGSYDLLQQFDPKLCTHLIYSFAGLDNNTSTIKSLDPFLDLEDDYGKGWFKKTTALKQRHPHLKVLLAIGGWNEGSEKYSDMAADPEKREKFVQSAVDMIRKYSFDGLDLDWEFPAKRGGKPEDKKHFTILAQELRTKFDKYGLQLSAAMGASQEIVDSSYELKELSRLLDHIHIMCYDYHGAWDKKTSHNAPLYGEKLSVEESVNYYIKKGAAPEKLVLGLPLYGRTFLLNDPEQSGSALEKEAGDKGFQGPLTGEDGFLGYNEICIELHSNRGMWKTYWDSNAKVPYMRSNAKFVSFDNPKSLMKKVEFAMSRGLGGAMVWSIETDDFLGLCGGPRYPLLKAINYALATEEDNTIRKTSPKTPTSNNNNQKKKTKPSSATLLTFNANLIVILLTSFMITA